MNIKQAAVHIKNAMKVYFMKDENGNYIFPSDKQRPIFLIGAPGIGKTAVIEQLTGEMGVGLVAYSMTHHTRQSALGLPFIVRRSFEGEEYSATEYTMSEIIGSIYDYMEKTGKREGILFLDEINCVSETLAPAMLEFLQYKVFGTHKVPDGWMIVTAGNPPQFNRSVREFDVATLDRLKVIQVEPDYAVWREYAVKRRVHPAVTAYLDGRSEDFYSIEATPSGKSYVTARGWEDLSQMLQMYEAADIDADAELCAQYLGNKRVAADFYDCYALYRKYSVQFGAARILRGEFDGELCKKAAALPLDERLTVTAIVAQQTVSELSRAQKGYESAVSAAACAKTLPRDGFAAALLEKAASVRENARLISENGAKNKAQSANYASVAKQLEYLHGLCAELSPQDALRLFGENASQDRKNALKAYENAVSFITEAFGRERELRLFSSAVYENEECAALLRSHAGKFGEAKSDKSEIDALIASLE